MGCQQDAGFAVGSVFGEMKRGLATRLDIGAPTSMPRAFMERIVSMCAAKSRFACHGYLDSVQPTEVAKDGQR